MPGNRIYFSIELLKHLDYENQVAAALAIELANLRKKFVSQRVDEQILSGMGIQATESEPLAPIEMEELTSVRFFGPAGVFYYLEKDRTAAVEEAVYLLYRAGYDPRGLSSVFELYAENSQFSPIEANTLPRLIEETRRVIAQLSPLLNPVVRTEAFIQIKKRIEKL